MATEDKTIITVSAVVDVAVEKAWACWNEPEHIRQWAFASDEWHVPKAENDLQVGGRFLTRMEAKDGSMGFDFDGVYGAVKTNEYIEYTIGDGRKVTVTFTQQDSGTLLVESFEAESTNPVEMQQAGWQSILNNFKKYAEATE